MLPKESAERKCSKLNFSYFVIVIIEMAVEAFVPNIDE
jgi:hypothetical protein